MGNSGRYRNKICPQCPPHQNKQRECSRVLSNHPHPASSGAGRFKLLCEEDSASCGHSGSRQQLQNERTGSSLETGMLLFEKMMFKGRGVTKEQKENSAAPGSPAVNVPTRTCTASGQGGGLPFPAHNLPCAFWLHLLYLLMRRKWFSHKPLQGQEQKMPTPHPREMAACVHVLKASEGRVIIRMLLPDKMIKCQVSQLHSMLFSSWGGED